MATRASIESGGFDTVDSSGRAEGQTPSAAGPPTATRISVAEAERMVLQAARSHAARSVGEIGLLEATGHILAEEIRADRPFPPFDRVTMDGIAFSVSDYRKGTRRFAIAGVQPAGAPPVALQGPGTCIEVMTGAVLPTGCDCVVPVEKVDVSSLDDGSAREAHSGAAPAGRVAVLKADAEVSERQFIHAAGSDFPDGGMLVAPGTTIGPPEIAVCASVGKPRVRVLSPLRIAILSSGDEIVDVASVPLPHQIRTSNGHAVRAALAAHGFPEIELHHVPDSAERVQSTLTDLLGRCDLIVSSGGVSMGKFDLLPGVLDSLGVRARFHRVLQRPGQPLWFGTYESVSGDGTEGHRCTVFGLPGNPVSTLVCAVRYVAPYIENAGRPAPSAQSIRYAQLETAVDINVDLTVFLPVQTGYNAAGVLTARPRPVTGSGDFGHLSGTDGFVELPPGRKHFAAGTAWRYFSWM